LEQRPLISFILTSWDFEFKHIMLQDSGKAQLANIFMNQPFGPSRPFYPAIPLLKLSGFLGLVNQDVDAGSHMIEQPLLKQLFFTSCFNGQLNTVNSLVSLIYTGGGAWRLHLIGILGGILDVVEEAGLEYEASIIKDAALYLLEEDFGDEPLNLGNLCSSSLKFDQSITHTTRVEAAVSQLLASQIFDGGSAGFWNTLADLEAGAWLDGTIYGYQERRRKRNIVGSVSTYRRSPFTKVLESRAHG
jgi:hypothetical protein